MGSGASPGGSLESRFYARPCAKSECVYIFRSHFGRKRQVDLSYSTGNFLKRINPEKVIYYPDEIDVRAGWDLVQEFILQ